MEKSMLEYLAEKLASAADEAEFSKALFDYIIGRLELPRQTREKDIYLLVLYSVRLKMPNEDIKTLESRLATVDCHQTSYIVSKKTLLMMETEQIAGAHLSPEEAGEISDTDEYAAALWRIKNGGK